MTGVTVWHATAVTALALLVGVIGLLLLGTARQVGNSLVSALSGVAEALAEGSPVDPDLLGRVEALERRVTDVSDVTERRYRAILQRDRRASESAPEPQALAEEVAPPPSQSPLRRRLVRKQRRG
jgi:Flp pilus assembly pilin Flp